MHPPVVTSTQWIELPGAAGDLESRGRPEVLLRLLRDYFGVAERCSGGVVRLRWRGDRPRFTLLWPPLTLIDMAAPAYDSGPERCAVSLEVTGGWLVDPGSKPGLAIALTRRTDELVASVELGEYAPRRADWAVVRWVYLQTQARIHARVGLTYLRQLQRRWLPVTPSGRS